MSSIKYRLANKKDIQQLADLHYLFGRNQIGGFMHRLGRSFFKVYYNIHLNERNSIILVAEDEEGKIHGFTSGTLSSEEHLFFLKRNRIKLAISVLFAVIKSPKILKELFARLDFVLLKSKSEKYGVIAGPRIDYWVWETKGNINKSVFLFRTWLEIAFSYGVPSVKGEIDIENQSILTIHKHLGARIIQELTLKDGRKRVIIEFVNKKVNNQYFIRNMSILDIKDVVQIHILAFSKFFLTELGPGFISELYRGFLLSNMSICMVAINNSTIDGFIIGTLNPKVFFKRLLFRNGLRFLFHASRATFQSPAVVIKKLCYALNYRGEQPGNFSNSALLSSIGVNPSIEAKGLGSILVESFCKEAFSRGSDSVYLTTDKESNEKVNSFYLKNEFKLDAVIEQTNNSIMNRYLKLPNEESL